MREKKLLTLLQKKKGFFEVIAELAEKEVEMPAHEWVSALEQKKILLSCIDEIDAEMEPYKDSFHTLSQEIHEELENIKGVIQKIMHLDSTTREKRKKLHFKKDDLS